MGLISNTLQHNHFFLDTYFQGNRSIEEISQGTIKLPARTMAIRIQDLLPELDPKPMLGTTAGSDIY
jgi:hypothetical protein